MSLVIEPKKRKPVNDKGDDTISKYGTYIRYRRINDYDNIKNRHNYICYTNTPTDFTYKESNITFMNIEFKHNNYVNQIVLKDESRNYYIDGNIIDKNFVKYYIETYLSNEINEVDFENFKYTLTILDNDVNQIKIDETQAILIEKDSYKIIVKPKCEEENIHVSDEVINNNNDKTNVLESSEDEKDKLYDFVNLENTN
jgi:hypothetical protein